MVDASVWMAAGFFWQMGSEGGHCAECYKHRHSRYKICNHIEMNHNFEGEVVPGVLVLRTSSMKVVISLSHPPSSATTSIWRMNELVE